MKVVGLMLPVPLVKHLVCCLENLFVRIFTRSNWVLRKFRKVPDLRFQFLMLCVYYGFNITKNVTLGPNGPV